MMVKADKQQALIAERAFLGSCQFNGQYDPQKFIWAVLKVEIEHLWSVKHRLIYGAMIELYRSSNEFNLVTLTQYLHDTGKLDEIGGSLYLAELINSCPDPTSWEPMADMILDAADVRNLRNIGALLQSDSGATLNTLVDDGYTRLRDLKLKRTRNPIVSMRDVIAKNLQTYETNKDNPQTVQGLRFGIPKLDEKVGGGRPGWLIVVLANSNMGKTTLTASIGSKAIQQGPGLICSTEQNPNQFVNKLISAMTKIPVDRIDSGQTTEQEDTSIRDCMAYLETNGTDLINLGSPDIGFIKTSFEVGIETKGYQWLLVDSFNKCSFQGQSDIYSVSKGVADGLQDIALLTQKPVIATAQAKPEVTTRRIPVPNLEDFYGGATLGQNADVVLTIYNHDHYVRKSGYDATRSDDNQKPGVVLPDPLLPYGTALVTLTKHRHKTGVNEGVKLQLVGGAGFYQAENQQFTSRY